MILLIGFAFLAGLVTVLSPCILPLLPIILSSSDSSGKQRPIGVVVGFIASFTFFTLFLASIVKLSGIPANSMRFISIVILTVFGVSLFIPQVQSQFEKLFSKFAKFAPSGKQHSGFGGGILIGLSLGLLWTPCVGPILASVISLAITGSVNAQTFLITLVYAVGTAIPMFGIMLVGSTALKKIPWLVQNTTKIQKAFGILMILTAIGIAFNIDRQFQTYILKTFPQYGTGLTKFEETSQIKEQLNKINKNKDNMKSQSLQKTLENITKSKGVAAPKLILGGQWFNSKPLSLADLKGKVVLVDFWTYSCINCQRTLPYLRQWWQKYQDKGLVIIGVHSPEFAFEKDPKNVSRAIKDFQLDYPIMQDNDFATWKNYKNHYWPAKYLIDKDGNIRYTHFGEGKYDDTEKMIQELLQESGSDVSNQNIDNPEYRTYSRTPELYLGHARIQYLSSPEKIQPNQWSIYTLPEKLSNNSFAFQGEWLIMPEYAAPKVGSIFSLNFEAQAVYLVAKPSGDNSKIKVYLDDKLQDFGTDNVNGIVTIDSDKLYNLIKLPKPGRHNLKIEFMDNNSEIYALTFG